MSLQPQPQLQQQVKLLETQIKKKLTFKDIMPTWHKIIEKLEEYGITEYQDAVGLSEKYGMNFANTSKCFVGEAHGKNDGYMGALSLDNKDNYCHDCSLFAYSQDLAAWWGVHRSKERRDKFYNTMERFVDHWNDVHVK